MMEWNREKSPHPKEWEWEKGRWLLGCWRVTGRRTGYGSVWKKNQLYGFMRGHDQHKET